MLIEAFHKNRNVNNKIYGNMENFDASTFDDLIEGVDIGFKSFNQLDFGKVHNKDLQFSYVEDGQRYYVSLLNSMNFHGGSMYFQSNFALVIKETECTEDSVFFTLADNTTKGIVEHEYLDTVLEYLPEDGGDGYTYHPCANCDKKQILDTIHRSGEWIIVRNATNEQSGVKQRSCTACDILLEVQEFTYSGDATQVDLSDNGGKQFTQTMDAQDVIEVTSTPKTIEATIQLDTWCTERGGVIVGNYDNSTKNQINLEIYKNGTVRLFFINNRKRADHIFQTDIRSDKAVHLAVTIDDRLASLYVDGELKETLDLQRQLPAVTDTFWIGGDGRVDNKQYFRGTIYNVNLFSDVRTAEEIRQDALAVFPDEEDLLVSKSYSETLELPQQMKALGKTFDKDTIQPIKFLASAPKTIEAVIQVPRDYSDRAGVVVGNYNGRLAEQINLEIYTNGNPRLYIHNGTSSATYLFPVDVRSDAPVHLAITFENLTATLYVNGEAVDTQTMRCALPDATEGYMVGGDHRTDNEQYFKGTIYSVNLFSEARSAEQIKKDIVTVPATEEHLMFSGTYMTDETMVDTDGGRIFIKEEVCNIGDLSAAPLTMEAVIQVNTASDKRGGIIVGSYDDHPRAKMTLAVYTEGRIRLFYQTDAGKRASCVFLKDVRSDKPVHVAVTIDGMVATLYFNGVKTERRTLSLAVPEVTYNYSIGGDNRTVNTEYFRGKIYSINLFSDVRTAEEIAADATGVSVNADNVLYARDYRTYSTQPAKLVTSLGKQVSQDDYFYTSKLTSRPLTIEAVAQLDPSVTDRGGVIVGNYKNGPAQQVNLEVYTEGRVRLFYKDEYARAEHVFQTDIRSNEAVHITVTVDGTLASLYINGELKETATMRIEMPMAIGKYRVGNDMRKENIYNFKGTIYSVNLFSTVRTAEQVKNDVIAVDTTDPTLLDSVMFAQDVCAQNGHVAGDWVQDITDPDAKNLVSHTQCTKCGKHLQYSKVPQTVEIVTQKIYENAAGFKPVEGSPGVAVDPLTTSPHTFEAVIQLDKEFSQRAGVVVGSYNGTTANQLNLEIYNNGKPRFYYRTNKTVYAYNFKTDIRSANPTHIALTVDGLTVKLYVDGSLKETATLTAALPEITNGFVIGGDHRTNNTQYFKGTIYAAHMFSDIRTAEEIAVDRYLLTQDAEDVLVSKYFLTEE